MLKGPRLTLRPLTKADMASMLRYGNDVEVELLAGGDPPTPGTLEGWEDWYAKYIVDNSKSATFAIEADGKFLGTCGIWQFKPHAQTCDMGIGIGDRDYWGRGYGREAIGLILDYAFRIRNFRKVCLNTNSSNERAIRCYLACGFVEEGRLRKQLYVDGSYVDEVHMGIFREEFEARSDAK